MSDKKRLKKIQKTDLLSQDLKDMYLAKLKAANAQKEAELESLKKDLTKIVDKNRQIDKIYTKLSQGYAINDLEALSIGWLRL